MNQTRQEFREQQILRLLQECGQLSTGEIAKRLGISSSTVRRHLTPLCDRGLLTHEHGKAICRTHMVNEDSISRGYRDAMEAKARIAEAALAHIRPGASIMMGGGTTCLALARLLAKCGPECLVITPSIAVASVLAPANHVELWIPGGMIYHRSQYLVGEDTRSYLSSHFVQLCFVGCDALSLESGITTVNPLEAEIDRYLIRGASHAVLLSDSRKFDRTSITRICPLSNLSHIITDTDADAGFVERVRSQGISVEQV